jgi:methionine-rich copper-binding protein CopC
VLRPLHLGLVFLAVLVTLGFRPGTASAHAQYKSSTPANGAVLSTGPAGITIVFTEAFVPAQSSASVSGPDGARVDNGDARADLSDADRKTMVLTLRPNLANGVYTVHWKTVSADDGDEAQGAFAYRVGAGQAPEDLTSEWPPVKLRIEATASGTLITYRMYILNLSQQNASPVTVKGLIPPGARLVSSYAFQEGANAGKSDGLTVGWTLVGAVPPAQPGSGPTRFGPFAYTVDVAGMKPGTEVRAHAWAQWILYSISTPGDCEQDEDGTVTCDDPDVYVDQIGGTSVSQDAILVIGPNGLPASPGG